METATYQTDVLIIGGGTAGLPAANKIKELKEDLDVLVVDKGGIGWAGQAVIGGGHLIFIDPQSGEAGIQEWVESVTQYGEGLCNLDWLNNYARGL